MGAEQSLLDKILKEPNPLSESQKEAFDVINGG